MKKIYLLISSITLALILSACGGGEGGALFESGGEGGALFESGTESIIVIQCDNNNSAEGINDCGNAGTPDYYTCLNSNDTLVSDDDNTLYKIVDVSTGVKKVCVEVTIPQGAAHILRGN